MKPRFSFNSVGLLFPMNKKKFFFQVFLNTVVSFDYDSKLTNENNTKIMFAKILKSLLKLNEERITNLHNLYLLNNYDYGKGSLRTFPNAENYDDLIKNMRVILSELHNNVSTE